MNSFSSVTVTLPVRFHIPILQRPMVMYGKVCREKGPGRRGTATHSARDSRNGEFRCVGAALQTVAVRPTVPSHPFTSS
jgi:hypothetical protein